MSVTHRATDAPPITAAPVTLSGVGHYFPGEPLTNAYFEGLEDLDVTDEWIRRHTGVQSRHWPEDENERHVEMGREAALRALDDAGLTPDDVDVLIGTTATARPRTNRSSAGNRYMDISLPLQHELGVKQAVCFDVTAVACAGFLYGSVVARSLLGSLGVRNALVVCAERPQDILNTRFRNSVLFGAGAGAAVWTRDDDRPESGLIDAVLRSDGEHYGAFDIDDNDRMVMKGKLVGELGPDLLTDAATRILERNGLTSQDVRWIIPHQGNLNMIQEVAKRLDAPEDKVLLNLPHRGNTSSVGVPSCLSEHIASGVVEPGDLILSISIGRGFSWGAMLYRYQ
ncbi:3-oxoacyl-ACP synthase III family protein [Streptomyces spiramenti]|uniref:Ketoacyl-ACP synthase III n=1 Tax=Streptomyces spiramenti TaxID=2720606 RepID=A0ABX1AQI0_9ACTN|nr:ketoacyl-ACP synthase III [Streptomyces spiramenti]NJP66948.1 ketoacyl-ACP synthase III [Streptomyces spiramenti]